MRILIAYDLSAEADRAARLVAASPWPRETVVRIVTSPSNLGMPLSSFSGPSAATSHAEQTRARIAAGQEGLAAELTRAGCAVETSIVAGRPGEAVVEAAERFRADLVVAGAGRVGAVEAVVLGSVSGEIAERTPCSVLVVRTTRLERVLLATDGSPPATEAVTVVAEWPLFETADVRVVAVEPAGARDGIALTDVELGDPVPAVLDAEGIVDAAVDRLRAANRTVSAETRHGDPRSEVMAAAREDSADLVVVGVNGEPLLRRLLLGSVARQVLRDVTSSVLIVRPGRA